MDAFAWIKNGRTMRLYTSILIPVAEQISVLVCVYINSIPNDNI